MLIKKFKKNKSSPIVLLALKLRSNDTHHVDRDLSPMSFMPKALLPHMLNNSENVYEHGDVLNVFNEVRSVNMIEN